jgi:hypothetical protein
MVVSCWRKKTRDSTTSPHPSLYQFTHHPIAAQWPRLLSMQPLGSNKTNPGIFQCSQGNKATVLHLTAVGLSARYTLIQLARSIPRSTTKVFFSPSPRLDDAKRSGHAWSPEEVYLVARFSSHLGPLEGRHGSKPQINMEKDHA